MEPLVFYSVDRVRVENLRNLFNCSVRTKKKKKKSISEVWEEETMQIE